MDEARCSIGVEVHPRHGVTVDIEESLGLKRTGRSALTGRGPGTPTVRATATRGKGDRGKAQPDEQDRQQQPNPEHGDDRLRRRAAPRHSLARSPLSGERRPDLTAAVDTELPVGAAEVVLDRLGGHEQQLGDVAVAVPRRGELGHSQLARRQ